MNDLSHIYFINMHNNDRFKIYGDSLKKKISKLLILVVPKVDTKKIDYFDTYILR